MLEYRNRRNATCNGTRNALGILVILAVAAATLAQTDISPVAAPLPEPDAAPECAPLDGRTIVTVEGQDLTVEHWPHSVRSPKFRVAAQIGGGAMVEVFPAPARTIRGIIRELPGSVVAGALLDDGLHAALFLPDGRRLWVEPNLDSTAEIAQMLVPQIAAATNGLSSPRDASRDSHEPMFSIECMVAEIAFDADLEMYQKHNSSVQEVVDRIETILNATNLQYESEVGIIHEITEIIVRTTEAENPYTSNNPVTLLQQFRGIWNTPPESDIVRDLAHLYTGKVLDGGVVGIAFIGSVCNLPNAYAVIRDMAIPFDCMTDAAARMLGVNWNATTCNCPGTTMHIVPECANTFIGPGSNSVDEILAFKDSLDCIEPCQPMCEPPDLNCDGTVGVADLLILLGAWGPCADCDDCPADLDGDCAVGVSDMLVLLEHWG